jgi:acylphosphatase
MTAKRYIVRGRVQGVGFRWFVEREANALGMRGWVRNNEDSTVELIAVGEDPQQESLRSRLEQGPRGSRVDRVDEAMVEEVELARIEKLGRFEIQGAW